ncbi:IPTL-CTERM sorting domain-containing protein [Brevundimonas sp.]|uniref:IPTL-CTERM sorting domain-containing protein n=1 Tax=Brevundimonas sp. TaxID=1871086 RepID=UPI002614ABB7|nr:IPTL-CTERM sorting domain-containing protein [Brevundimonas sp.]
MVAKSLRNVALAGGAALAVLGGWAATASAQTASLYSSAISQPTDTIVLSDGGPAYVSSDTGVYYLPTPAGVPVRISSGGGFRELAMMADGSLLAGRTDGGVYRYAANCTTQAGCGEAYFADTAGGGGVYGVAVDNVNSYVYFTGYDGDVIRRTNLSGGSPETFVSSGLDAPAGLEIGTDGFLYVGDSDNQRVMRYPANCTAPCGSGTVFASGGGITSTRGVERSPSTGVLFISDGGALGSGKVYTVGAAGGTPVQYSALSVNGVESIYLIDGTNALYVSGGVGGGSPNLYKISVTAAAAAFAVPTMSEWAMILLGIMLAGSAAIYIHRRHPFG